MRNSTDNFDTVIIEKGCPLPTIKYGKKYEWLEKLEIGDSVLIRAGTKNQLSSAMYVASMKTGFKYTQRKMEDGIRIWRIK